MCGQLSAMTWDTEEHPVSTKQSKTADRQALATPWNRIINLALSMPDTSIERRFAPERLGRVTASIATTI
jgi:hypothetical protein